VSNAGQALLEATSRLRAAAVESPRLDAELLLCFVLGISRTSLIAHPEKTLSPSEAGAYEGLLARRTRREPLPHLTGRQPFLDFELEVSGSVLIPRPETEGLVEAAVGLLPHVGRVPLQAVDIGAGSGAVAIGLSLLRPDVQIHAADCSPDALRMARSNARRLGVVDRIQFVLGDLFAGVDPGWRGRIDLVVSNPPYVPTAVVDSLEPEVSRFEPRLALDGGLDGLAVIRRLVIEAPNWLRPSGAMAMEIGAGQADAVVDLLEDAGYKDASAIPDLARIPRVITARWPGESSPR
jgi:release factor glutamine methyltransferase